MEGAGRAQGLWFMVWCSGFREQGESTSTLLRCIAALAKNRISLATGSVINK